MIAPETGGRSGLNRDAPLLFLLHEVGSGSTVMYFAGFMDLTGELENSLCCGGLTRINVGENSDISVKG